MSSDSNEGSLPRQVGVKLVLKVDEGSVVERVEFDVTENRGREVGTDLGSLLADVDNALLTLPCVSDTGQRACREDKQGKEGRRTTGAGFNV